MKEHIQYDFLFDNHFNELKEIEIMTQRIAVVTQMDPLAGKYFSVEYIRRHILNQTDKTFKEIDKQIKSEISSGLAIDPKQTNMMDTMSKQNSAFSPEISNIQAQDAASREAESADASLDRKLEKMKEQSKLAPKSK
jgi:hypothetical protein